MLWKWTTRHLTNPDRHLVRVRHVDVAECDPGNLVLCILRDRTYGGAAVVRIPVSAVCLTEAKCKQRKPCASPVHDVEGGDWLTTVDAWRDSRGGRGDDT